MSFGKRFIKMLTLAAVAIGLLFAGSRPAQAATQWQAGLHFLAGLPQGEFDDNLDRNAYGAAGQIFFSPSRSPIAIGLSLGVANYGDENRMEPFSTTIPDVTVDVNTSNNMFQGHLIFRTQYKMGDIRPYADGLVGFNYLWTKTTIDNASNGEEVASSTNLDDAVFSYGAGGGVMVRVYKSGGNQGQFEIMIDLGARYMWGGEAEYLKEGSIRRENGAVVYDITKSKTDILMFQVGVTGNF
jgi:hypothetical protein